MTESSRTLFAPIVDQKKLHQSFERLRSWSDPLGQHWAFTGRFLDEETGLYYFRARYYDAERGRFIQRDPLGYGEGPNLFTYVYSAPVNLVDPSGAGVGSGDPGDFQTLQTAIEQGWFWATKVPHQAWGVAGWGVAIGVCAGGAYAGYRGGEELGEIIGDAVFEDEEDVEAENDEVVDFIAQMNEAGQDAYDEAIEDGATPEEAEEAAVDAMEPYKDAIKDGSAPGYRGIG